MNTFVPFYFLAPKRTVSIVGRKRGLKAESPSEDVFEYLFVSDQLDRIFLEHNKFVEHFRPPENKYEWLKQCATEVKFFPSFRICQHKKCAGNRCFTVIISVFMYSL